MPAKKQRKHKSSVYLEPDVKQQLKLVARQLYLSEAQFIRDAIEMKLAQATSKTSQRLYAGLEAITGMAATNQENNKSTTASMTTAGGRHRTRQDV